LGNPELLQDRFMPLVSRTRFFTAAALAAALLAPVSGARAADTINVLLDQAKIVQLPLGTSTIVVGNPVVVDVTMLKGENRVVLTGKGFGETNLIAVDARGEALGESVIRVAAGEKHLIVQRGLERESYHCDPRCQPTVSLGDATKFLGEAIGQVSARNGAASSAPR
jgi:hypothetical protein